MTRKSIQREAFEAFADRAEERLDSSLKRLVLYGSVAKGSEDRDSDVDIFAVVESREDKSDLEDLAFDVGLEFDVAMTPIIKTEEEYSDLEGTLYLREVGRTGEARV